MTFFCTYFHYLCGQKDLDQKLDMAKYRFPNFGQVADNPCNRLAAQAAIED